MLPFILLAGYIYGEEVLYLLELLDSTVNVEFTDLDSRRRHI